MKPAILTLIFCANVAGWGWESYDYDSTEYMEYGYSDYGGLADYYYDVFDVMEPKCEIKPWTRKHTCPKIYDGKCARDLLKKKKGKGKRRKELKQMKKKLRERWCKKPDMLSNGKVATPCGLGLFQTAISSCDKGYKLIPKESKKGRCELNKKWSGKKPECKADCGMVAPIDNGKVNVSGTLQGSVAKYKCSLAFTLEGPEKRICQNDRNWSGQLPRCNLVDCGNLTHPENGAAIQSGTKFESITSYICNTGYSIVPDGPCQRRCLSDGSWSGTEPKCIRDCGPITHPQNGRVTVSGTLEGSIAQYDCSLAFNMTGPEERSCQSDGSWSGQPPVCSLIDCGNLTHPEFGKAIQTGTKFESTTTYTCNIGYQPVPEGPCQRRCLSDGSWSGTEPKCIRDCGPLTHPPNGRVTVSGTLENSMATYECSYAFILTGPEERTCQNDGSWSGQPPNCNLVDCGAVGDPEFGKVNPTGTKFEDIATYSCIQGYQLDPEDFCRRRCLADGNWSDFKPKCISVCGNLPPPVNGNITLNGTTENSKAKAECDSGYTLMGSEERICQRNGKWSGPPALCVIGGCDENYYNEAVSVLPTLNPDCQTNKGGCKAVRWKGADDKETNVICKPVLRKKNVTCSFTVNQSPMTQTMSVDIVDRCKYKERTQITIKGRVITRDEEGAAIGVGGVMLTIRDYFGTFNSTALGLFSLELYLNDFKLENTPYIFPQIITIKAQKIDYPLSFKQVPVTTEIDVIQDIDIVLFSQLEAVTFNPEDGLSVNTTSGASVTVPPNMGFKDGNGNVVSTPVKAEVAAIDPATTNLDELPVKLQTTNGEPLQSFGLINPSFKDENGYNIVPNNEIEISVPNQDVPDLNLYGATPNGDLEEVPGGNTRKKRQATGNIVYKIGAEYIGKWLSISKAFKQPLCYAKMRVFTNSTFSTQVTDGQISFLPVVIMKVFKGTSMSGYTRNIKGTDAPSQDCYAVRCSTNTTTIKGEITLHGGKLVTKPIPPNDPALPMELDASLTNLNYKIDSGKRIASLIFNTTTDGPLFKNKTVCESAPKEKSLWFALPTQQPAEVNFGDEVCYARIILRFKSKKKKKSSSTKTPNFDLFATSFPSNARSIVNLNDMPIMAVSNTFSACARYTCSKSGANTTVAWYILPTSDFTFGCGKIIPLTPPVINATTSGYYYGTDEITVKAACQNETSMSLGFARSVVCKWRPKITK